MAQGILLASRLGALRPFDLVPRSQHPSVGAIERHFSPTSALGRPLQVERVTLSLCSSLAHCGSSKTWKGRPCGHKYAQIIGKYGHHLVISDWIDMSAVFQSVSPSDPIPTQKKAAPGGFGSSEEVDLRDREDDLRGR